MQQTSVKYFNRLFYVCLIKKKSCGPYQTNEHWLCNITLKGLKHRTLILCLPGNQRNRCLLSVQVHQVSQGLQKSLSHPLLLHHLEVPGDQLDQEDLYIHRTEIRTQTPKQTKFILYHESIVKIIKASIDVCVCVEFVFIMSAVYCCVQR